MVFRRNQDAVADTGEGFAGDVEGVDVGRGGGRDGEERGGARRLGVSRLAMRSKERDVSNEQRKLGENIVPFTGLFAACTRRPVQKKARLHCKFWDSRSLTRGKGKNNRGGIALMMLLW